MLVLTRKEGERIMIDGGKIVVLLVRSWDGKAQIGIDAPLHTPVHREEVQQDIDAGLPQRSKCEPPAAKKGDWFTRNGEPSKGSDS